MKKIIGILIIIPLIMTALPVVEAMNIEKSYERMTTGSGPDLNCEGEIIKNRVSPGSIVTGSFIVENIGELGSLLDWEVTEWPDFGTDWIFNPSSGEDLTPEEDNITVDVTFTAPTPEEPSLYGGVIKVCAVDDPNDSDLVVVIIGVEKSKEVNKPLLRIFERFIYMFPILRHLLR